MHPSLGFVDGFGSTHETFPTMALFSWVSLDYTTKA